MLDAAILVGGSSSRMGSDKALLDRCGRPAAVDLHHVLVEVGFDNVTLIGGDGSRFADHSVIHRVDTRPHQGPLGGILTALEATRSEWVLILAVDLPGVSKVDIEKVVEARRQHPFADIIHASSSEGPQPLFGWWRRSTAQTIDRALSMDRRSVRSVVGSLRTEHVEFEPSVLRNANRPEDLG
jgi:molybdopterin-guanine dinucleotide biosynthesis protein A